MLCPTDALPAPVLVDGVEPTGNVVNAGDSFAVSEEDAEAEAEVVKREPLDPPRGMVLLLVFSSEVANHHPSTPIRVHRRYACPCSRSCPSCA